MFDLHHTESGTIRLDESKNKCAIKFNNFGFELSLRSLKKLHQYLLQLDPNDGLFNPMDKCFEVCFSSGGMTLYFDYYEILEFTELIDDGLAQWQLRNLLTSSGITLSNGAEV
ncbi:MAG: DUF6686 family protein [Bacteroidota bacterium]